MKTILCYGDSNMWGADPQGRHRFSKQQRWAGIFANELGKAYDVITEGLPGRTTVRDDPLGEHCNGKTYLMPCLMSHAPLDLVIISLGTNDLKRRFNGNALDTAIGAGILCDVVYQSGLVVNQSTIKTLLVIPPPFKPLPPYLQQMFMHDSVAESHKFAQAFREVMPQYPHTHLLDAGEFMESSTLDGIHFDEENHQKLGNAIAHWVRNYLF